MNLSGLTTRREIVLAHLIPESNNAIEAPLLKGNELDRNRSETRFHLNDAQIPLSPTRIRITNCGWMWCNISNRLRTNPFRSMNRNLRTIGPDILSV